MLLSERVPAFYPVSVAAHRTISSDRLPELAYHVREQRHPFFQGNGRWFRENRLYQVAVDESTAIEEVRP